MSNVGTLSAGLSDSNAAALAAMRAAEEDRLRNMPVNLTISEATGGYIISGDYRWDQSGRQTVAVSIEDVLRIVEQRLRREA